MTVPIATLSYKLIPHTSCSKDPSWISSQEHNGTILYNYAHCTNKKTEAQQLSNLPKVAGGKEMVEMRFWILRFLVGRTEQEKLNEIVFANTLWVNRIVQQAYASHRLGTVCSADPRK